MRCSANWRASAWTSRRTSPPDVPTAKPNRTRPGAAGAKPRRQGRKSHWQRGDKCQPQQPPRARIAHRTIIGAGGGIFPYAPHAATQHRQRGGPAAAHHQQQRREQHQPHRQWLPHRRGRLVNLPNVPKKGEAERGGDEQQRLHRPRRCCRQPRFTPEQRRQSGDNQRKVDAKPQLAGDVLPIGGHHRHQPQGDGERADPEHRP